MRGGRRVTSLLRRPLALVAVLLCAVVAATIGYTQAEPTYESNASVVVIPAANAAATGEGDNPFIRLDDRISRLALVVAEQLSSDSVREQVEVAGGDGQYTADTTSGDDGDAEGGQLTPVIQLTATATTADGAEGAVTTLVQQAGAQLAAVQAAAGVRSDAQAVIITSAQASDPLSVGHPRARAAAVLGGLTTVAGLLILLVAGTPSDRSRRDPGDHDDDSSIDSVDVESAWDDDVPEDLEAATDTCEPLRVSQPVAAENLTEPQAADPGSERPDSEWPQNADPSTSESRLAAARDRSAAGRKQRDELIRQLVRDEWARSGRNVAWSRSERKAAFARAEQRLEAIEIAGTDDDPDWTWG